MCNGNYSSVNETENITENGANANANEEESLDVAPFWGEDDDNSSSSTTRTNDAGDPENQSTGQAILSIAIPALAGLAIDPLMVR